MTLIEEARLIGAMPSPEEARRIREQAGIGVSRLAEEIGVNRATINLWETGQRRPRGENRLRYARILHDLQELTDAA
ncbi:helix-turn-helix transcriptional regulator [Microbacterium sp. Clip185]|uniref:helix-turn-helix transcriptional regulator n=1 Tax=Microbacterium sp. Clip185 TaxID=3025663 RepID=UPI0023668F02|nr:helix-turn-helix transcriptional regulator [Microbacterium sp. Clip185]WDG17483.1 helix-turn-helix transcriptional regulator [Microbacterium sp. Clip185]